MGAHLCGICNSEPCECSRNPPDFGDNYDGPDRRLEPRSGRGGFHTNRIAQRAAEVAAEVADVGDFDLESIRANHPVVGRVTPARPADPITTTPNGGRESASMFPAGYGNGEYVAMEEAARLDSAISAASVKDTNPKDAVGVKKWRQYCTVPTTIIWELGVAMLEGARKYGRHNYRVAGVRGSVYVDAAKGHIDQWWEGEDIDVESGLSHITKAMASLAVMRDAMIQGKFVDDRPPKTDLAVLRDYLQTAVDGIFERIPEAKDAYLEGDQYDDVD